MNDPLFFKVEKRRELMEKFCEYRETREQDYINTLEDRLRLRYQPNQGTVVPFIGSGHGFKPEF